jgi:hypothetical protein
MFHWSHDSKQQIARAPFTAPASHVVLVVLDPSLRTASQIVAHNAEIAATEQHDLHDSAGISTSPTTSPQEDLGSATGATEGAR